MFGESQVSEDSVTSLVQQNVLRLQISVDNVQTVEVAEGGDDLGEVEDGSVEVESSIAAKIREEFPATNEWSNKIEMMSVNTPPGQLDQERMIDLLQDLLLVLDMLHLLVLNHVLQGQDLHGVVSFTWIVETQTNFTE